MDFCFESIKAYTVHTADSLRMEAKRGGGGGFVRDKMFSTLAIIVMDLPLNQSTRISIIGGVCLLVKNYFG